MTKNGTQSAEDVARSLFAMWHHSRVTEHRVKRMMEKGDRYSHPTPRLTDEEIFIAGFLLGMEYRNNE